MIVFSNDSVKYHFDTTKNHLYADYVSNNISFVRPSKNVRQGQKALPHVRISGVSKGRVSYYLSYYNFGTYSYNSLLQVLWRASQEQDDRTEHPQMFGESQRDRLTLCVLPQQQGHD